MTLHIDVDKNTESQLASFANLKKISVEEIAASYLKDKVHEVAEYNVKVRDHLALSETQADIGEFADYDLEQLKNDLDGEAQGK